MTHHPNQKTWLNEPTMTPRSFVPRPNEHSALPAEFTKAQAIQICAKALAAIGLASTTVAAWRLIADTTELSAWHSKSKSPINFRKVRDLACELGVSDRQWRRIEVQLEEHGLIARATTDNGFRGKAGGGALTFGLSLEPAIHNFAQLLDLSKRPEQEEQARKLCLGKIRATRKRLKALASFDPLSDEDAARWAAVEETNRPARLGYATLDALKPYLSALNGLEEHLRERQMPSLVLTENHTGSTPNMDAAPDTKQLKAPCPTPPKIDKTARKMSDAADTDVRCQYNLEYKQKRLNACHEGNQEFGPTTEDLRRPQALRSPEPERPAGNVCRLAPSSHSGSADQVTEKRTSQVYDSTAMIVDGLPANTLVDLAALTNVNKHSALLEDIKKIKQGTPCQTLDPQHIWIRFRRYNLKKDKTILPIAALRAFIKGWIVDGQQSYLAGQTGQKQSLRASQSHQNKAYRAGACTPSQVTTSHSKGHNPPSRQEVLDFYAAVLRKGGYIPQTMISPTIMRELKEMGWA